MKLFWSQRFFLGKFDLKNGCKNEFENNIEKKCSWSKNRVSHEIDFKAVWTHESYPTAWGLKWRKNGWNLYKNLPKVELIQIKFDFFSNFPPFFFLYGDQHDTWPPKVHQRWPNDGCQFLVTRQNSINPFFLFADRSLKVETRAAP